MPYEPVFELSTFETLAHPWKRGVLNCLVETLVMADRAYLRENPRTPLLYNAGVRYLFNFDRWQDIPTCIARRNADCKDLAAWRIAELREFGENAAVDVSTRQDGGVTVYHIRVLRGDGRIEDPSKLLGMGASDPH